jgi:Tol biopolymer transport system component
MIIILLALALSGCGTRKEARPAVVQVPTAPPGQDFECWSAPNRATTAPRESLTGHLIIGYGRSHSNYNLYSRAISSTDSVLIAKQVEGYSPEDVAPVSPDGKYLWYWIRRDDHRPSIFVDQVGVQNQQAVPFAGIYWGEAIGWSADGRCLIRRAEGGNAIAYRLSDGALQRRTFPGVDLGRISVSPDGQWWAWPCPGGICLMTPAGQQVQHPALEIPHDVEGGHFFERGLIRWSPDSHTMVFVYARVNPANLDRLRFVEFNGNAITSYDEVEILDILNMNWSPDGEHLLLAEHSGVPHIYDRSTKKATDISTSYGYAELVVPAWSPTGEHIAFVGIDGQNLYIMNAEGTEISEPIPMPTDEPPDAHVQYLFWVP